MRPRKRVLLIAISPDLVERYTLILHTWGLAAVTEEQYEARPRALDAVLAVSLPMRWLATLAAEHLTLPLVAHVFRDMDRSTATRMGAHYTSADHYVLREQLRIAVARKRGPKKAAPVESLTTQTERAA